MIKVYYKGLLKQDTIYDADGFYFNDGVPFRKSGLYITKDDKTVAIITITEAIDRVEYVNNQPQNVVFHMSYLFSKYRKEELSGEELITAIEDQLSDYFNADWGN